MECIICRKDKEAMSDEHVIPDSLGGFYHIYNVCIECNSRMGSAIDAPLVNHKLAELYRYVENMKGQSGQVPNPFSGALTAADDPTIKAQATVESDGRITVSAYPKIRVDEIGGEVVGIQITVDSIDEKEIERLLLKKIERLGIDPADVVHGERYRELHEGSYKGSWKIDLRRFKLGLLKIAYEFAVDSVDGFYACERAKDISSVLLRADIESVERYVRIGSGLQPEVFAPFEDYLDLESRKHYLALVQTEMGLICCIKLHGLFCIGVILSENRFDSLTSGLIGINDLDARSFRKLTFEQVIEECMGPNHTRIAYHFPTKSAAMMGMQEINSANFRYECGENEKIPLYREDGSLHSFMLHHLLEDSECTTLKENGWMVNRYEFRTPLQCFVKSVGSGALYQAVGIEISRQYLRKL